MEIILFLNRKIIFFSKYLNDKSKNDVFNNKNKYEVVQRKCGAAWFWLYNQVNQLENEILKFGI